jgi:hypothetical protein
MMRLNIMNNSLLQPSVKAVRTLLRNLAIILGFMLLVGGATPATAATATVTNTFVWNKDKEQMSADVRDWELLGLLETIAAETGWHVYVEPDDSFRASVKFKDLPTGQALRRLLGDMNFAMLPQTNGPQRLYVFRTAMGNATKQVRHGNVRSAPKPKKVPNELIVRVKPGTDIEALAKALGAKIVGKIPELNAYRLQFESEAAAEAARKKLLANPEVTSVENNYYLESPLNPQSLGGRAATPTKLTLSPVKRDSGKVVVGWWIRRCRSRRQNSSNSSRSGFRLPAIHLPAARSRRMPTRCSMRSRKRCSRRWVKMPRAYRSFTWMSLGRAPALTRSLRRMGCMRPTSVVPPSSMTASGVTARARSCQKS